MALSTCVRIAATWMRTCVPRRAPAARGPCYMRAAFGGGGDRALAKKTRKEEVAHARQVAETCERHSRAWRERGGWLHGVKARADEESKVRALAPAPAVAEGGEEGGAAEDEYGEEEDFE